MTNKQTKGYLGIVRPDDFCSRAEKRGGVR